MAKHKLLIWFLAFLLFGFAMVILAIVSANEHVNSLAESNSLAGVFYAIISFLIAGILGLALIIKNIVAYSRTNKNPPR